MTQRGGLAEPPSKEILFSLVGAPFGVHQREKKQYSGCTLSNHSRTFAKQKSTMLSQAKTHIYESPNKNPYEIFRWVKEPI